MRHFFHHLLTLTHTLFFQVDILLLLCELSLSLSLFFFSLTFSYFASYALLVSHPHLHPFKHPTCTHELFAHFVVSSSYFFLLLIFIELYFYNISCNLLIAAFIIPFCWCALSLYLLSYYSNAPVIRKEIYFYCPDLTSQCCN